jgi:hypothetical protein
MYKSKTPTLVKTDVGIFSVLQISGKTDRIEEMEG